MSASLVVVGSLNMDLVARTIRHPQPGETVLGSAFATFPGGKGGNQAVAAARIGGQVAMIGRVGADGFGDALVTSLAEAGVNTRYVLRTPQSSSGVALIVVSEEGQNSIVVSPGANGLLSPEDVKAAASSFEGASAVLLQLEVPLPTVIAAAELAHQAGARVILNPAPAQSLPNRLLHLVDVLIPNQSELALLTGFESITLGLDALLSLGCRNVLVTLGDRGVLVADCNGSFVLNGHSIPVVDTTAAGDAFVGAFAVALGEGKSIREAAAWGNAAGALAVTRAGAQPSLPARAEVEAFLNGVEK